MYPARILLSTVVLLTATSGCGDHDPEPSTDQSALVLPHSFARPSESRIDHMDLDLDVDFESRTLAGIARLSISSADDASHLRLDTDGLDIEDIWTIDTTDQRTAADYQIGEPVPQLGSELTIPISVSTAAVEIHYRTRPEAAAIQWLSAEQTAGDHPFLFTQSQAILARTWVPCQDTPAVRFTYTATVRVPEPLLAVMSAENPTQRSEENLYRFTMNQAIPSYLLALAVGELEFRELGPSSGVYAEPSTIERAAWEFAETESMMAAVAELYGPYRWGRYDILVLPPSFPFGGMENPRLTFATPTILAGDRSLVALIAHELAHSWSGNLVTNATWNDFWLNEGFTVYLERRIMEAIHGRDYSEMLALLGFQDLEATVGEIGPTHPDTHLALDLEGRNPDDGMTDIAYEKGYLLLRLLEENVGREAWDAFLFEYFEEHAFDSLTAAEFVSYLNAHLEFDVAPLRLDEWINGPGIPDNAPLIESNAFALVDAARESWQSGSATSSLSTDEWTTHEWLHFLRGLPSQLAPEQLSELDNAYQFTATGNSEILHAWLHHVIANEYQPGYPAVESFLEGMGRRKFLEPLYRRLAETESGLTWAREIYAVARPGYHPVSVATIDMVLDWDPSNS